MGIGDPLGGFRVEGLGIGYLRAMRGVAEGSRITKSAVLPGRKLPMRSSSERAAAEASVAR
jgi:hypothetical protein